MSAARVLSALDAVARESQTAVCIWYRDGECGVAFDGQQLFGATLRDALESFRDNGVTNSHFAPHFAELTAVMAPNATAPE